MNIRRRAVALAIAVLGSTSGVCAASGISTTVNRAEFDTDEGTAMNVDVSSDGREIVFDLLGDIYTLPIEGGRARLLLGGQSWDTAPRYSRDGKRIKFVRDREEFSELQWSMDRQGRHVMPLPHVETARQENTPYEPVDLPAYRSLISHNGRSQAYLRFTLPNRQTQLMIKNLGTGRELKLMRLDDGLYPNADAPLPAYAFTPDDRAIIISSQGKIWFVPCDGAEPRVIPFQAHVSQLLSPRARPRRQNLTSEFIDIKAIRAPVVSPDGRYLVFSAVGRLWIQDIESGERQRLTESNNRECDAAISPDGRWVAYREFPEEAERLTPGEFPMMVSLSRIMVAPLKRGDRQPPRVALGELAEYAAPLWFGDSRRLFAAMIMTEKDLSAVLTEFVWADTGAGRVYKGGRLPVIPGTSFPFQKFGAPELKAAIGPDERLYWLDSVDRKTGTLGSTPDPGHIMVYSVRLDGTDLRSHLEIAGGLPTAGGTYLAAIAPDARHVLLNALGNSSGIQLAVIPPASDSPPTVSILKNDPSIRRVDGVTASNLSWQDGKRFLYSLGPKITLGDTGGKALKHIDVKMSLPRYFPKGAWAIRDARLITMAGPPGREPVIERGTLVVRNGKLETVGPSAAVQIADDAVVIDGSGLTVSPGFIEVHNHGMGAALRPAPMPDPDGVSDLAYGFTTRYDPSTLVGDADLEHRERLETTGIYAVRYFFSGKPMGWVGGDKNSVLINLPGARRLLAKYDALGATVFKEYVYNTRADRRALVQAAIEQGLGITAEGTDIDRMLTIVVDGFTSFEHSGFILPIFSDVTQLMKFGGINWTPTVLKQRIGSPGGVEFFFKEFARQSPAEMKKLSRFTWPAYYQHYLDKPSQAAFSWEQTREYQQAQAGVRALRDGVTVSIGAHNAPGLLGHFEMWALVKAGATAQQVMRAATVNGAEKIGIDHAVGSIEVGKLADLAIFAANPLENIRNTTRISYVIVNGVIYDGVTMDRLWPEYSALPRQAWQTSAEYAVQARGKAMIH